jgi:hypothetical protein
MGASGAKQRLTERPTAAPAPEDSKERAQRKVGHERLCPECGNASIRRSRRRTVGDYVLMVAGFRPYRCSECNHRYHDRSRARRLPREPLSWVATCPRCGFTGVTRIARNKVPFSWGNLFWKMAPAYAYRCPECRKRFFDFRPAECSD